MLKKSLIHRFHIMSFRMLSMIRKFDDKDAIFLKKCFEKDKLQNPYFYIDVHSFGYHSDSVTTYVLENEGYIQCFIYVYFNTVQLYVVSGTFVNLKELADFILENQFSMISGNSTMIKLLSEMLHDDYNSAYGVIMEYKENHEALDCDNVEWASKSQCGDIASLICSDVNIGSHYDIHNLESQLIERMDLYNCRNIIIRDGQKIISHAATYADEAGIAIIGGVITSNSYRSQGHGKKCVLKLANQLSKENKIPLLYCYDENTVKWYNKMGWSILSDCGKLERLK